MLSKDILIASINAVMTMGDNIQDIKNPIINDIVNSYSHDYKTTQDIIDNHDVEKRNFTIHDATIKSNAEKLSNILNACSITWNSKVKPLAQSLITSISEKTSTIITTDVIDTLDLKNIAYDGVFSYMINPNIYPVYYFEKTLSSMSFSSKPRNIDEISMMIVESKTANPQAIMEYVAELPPDLITNVYNEVFVNRNANDFLPLDFDALKYDYMVQIKFGEYNLDKLYLTIMIASYLVNHPDDDINMSLVDHDQYYHTLIKATCSLAATWTEQLKAYITSGFIAPYTYYKNGVMHINIIANVLKDIPAESNVMESVIALAHILPIGSSICKNHLLDPEYANKINTYIITSNNRKNQEIINNTDRAVTNTLSQDAQLNNITNWDTIIQELYQYDIVYQKVLKWIELTRYKNTYLSPLINIYIKLSNINPNMDNDLINGKAMARLAAYIVTH